MADIKVVIQLQDTVEDIIEQLGSSTEVNNASIQKTNGSFGFLSTKSNGTNMKSWANLTYKNGEYVGSLSLADGFVGGADTQLIEQYGYNGYVFGAVPESKQLTVTLEVRGENVDSIIIYGDKNANQFPTKAYIDGDTTDIIYSDDATWAIKFQNVASSHTITFLEWNRANYNACITYVAELKNKLYLDRSWLKSVESLSQSTGQPKEIYYGVVPNSGSLEVLDVNGEFFDYINDGVMASSNLPIEINVNGKPIQSHISIDSDYYNNKILSIQTSDILQSWSNFKIKPHVKRDSAGTLMGYFKNCMVEFGFTEDYIEEMCSNVIRENMTAQQIMKLIRIPYQYYKSKTLLDFVNSICNVCQFCVATDNLGMPKFVNGNPTTSNNKIIRIPLSQIFGTPKKDVITKNKIQNVKYMQKSFVKNVKDVCNRTFLLRDNNDTFTTSQLDGGKIITKDGVDYLCFFIECNEINSEFIWDVNSSEDNVEYPFIALIRGTNSLGNSIKSFIQTVGISTADNVTKDNYDFYNFKGNCCELTYYRTLNSKTFAIALSISSITDYASVVDDVTVNIMQRSISVVSQENHFNDIQDNVYELNDSEFMSLQTTYNYIDDIYTYNSSQIVNSYNNGISVANITIGCSNLYDINGNVVKHFSEGDVVEVGDTLRIDRDNNNNSLWEYKDGSPMYWKVTGRNFRKNGVPMIDLELQEVRVVD